MWSCGVYWWVALNVGFYSVLVACTEPLPLLSYHLITSTLVEVINCMRNINTFFQSSLITNTERFPYWIRVMKQWINYIFGTFLWTLDRTAKGLYWTRQRVPLSRYLEPNSSSWLQLPSSWHSVHFRPSDCCVASRINSVSYSELMYSSPFHASLQNTETCFGRSSNLWPSVSHWSWTIRTLTTQPLWSSPVISTWRLGWCSDQATAKKTE